MNWRSPSRIGDQGAIGDQSRVYHHVTPKHLPRYVNEFSFRLNEGNVRNHTTERLDSLVRRAAGKRLTLEALTNA